MIYDKLREELNILKNRPKMILTIPNFNNLKYYLFGYLNALGNEHDSSLTMDITKWLQQKTNRNSSLFWFDHIYSILADGDDEKAYSLVLHYLEAFLNEKAPSVRPDSSH